MPPRKNYKKKPVRRARKATKPRKSTNVAEYASLSEVRTIISPGSPAGNFVNTLYSLMNTTLGQFTRATTVAKAYQFYRIKHIKLTYKAPFDSFVNNSTVGYNKPYLYYMIDKSGALPTNITLEGLKQMGAKPRALDEKPLTVSWAPSVLQDSMVTSGPASTSQGSSFKISPWLNTNSVTVGTPWNASQVDHLGVYWFLVASAQGSPPPMGYDIECEVQFEFKKPLIATTVGAVHATPATFATLDASPDGVEGGADGITIPLGSTGGTGPMGF